LVLGQKLILLYFEISWKCVNVLGILYLSQFVYKALIQSTVSYDTLVPIVFWGVDYQTHTIKSETTITSLS